MSAALTPNPRFASPAYNNPATTFTRSFQGRATATRNPVF